MYPLFETVCIKHATIQNRSYHEERFLKSYLDYFKKKPEFSLFDGVKIPKSNTILTYKLKISYGKTNISYTITEYCNKIPKTLRVVFDDDILYDLKFLNRDHLNELYQLRDNAEDILIIKHGLVTDTSYANILFKKGDKITTPVRPLLPGTCRARIINELNVLKKNISKDEIHDFDCFQLINAMNDFDDDRWIPVSNIFLNK